MSKICEKCGGVIPDGAASCPNCGREDYNDAALLDVLSELGLALDGEEPEDSGGVDLDLSALDALLERDGMFAEAEEAVDGAEPDEPEMPEEPDSADITMIFDTAKIEKTAKKQQEAQEPAREQKPKQQLKRVQTQRDRSEEPERTSRKSQKRQMKKRSAAVIGVLVGLIVALLLIAGIIAFMLFQMGFFDTMSDDELLGVSSTSTTTTVTASPSPTVEAVVSTVEEEAPAEEAEEESVEEEPEEPAEEDEEEPIEVNKFKVTGASTIYLYNRGDTDSVVYVIEPAAAESSIEWTSSDETVAAVDSFGTIRARRGGVCTITGTCGEVFISVSVVCDFEVPDTVLDMNMEDITMSYEGQTVNLAIDYELTAEQEAATVWESSDESVATVDDEGLVTAIANGTAVITASIGDYTASCIVRCVNVTGNKGYNSTESEYTINYEDVTLTRKGEYFQLKLTSILGNEVPDFTWKSDDTSVATVDSNGVVTAVSNGTAYITATVGEDKFRCIVRVNISD